MAARWDTTSRVVAVASRTVGTGRTARHHTTGTARVPLCASLTQSAAQHSGRAPRRLAWGRRPHALVHGLGEAVEVVDDGKTGELSLRATTPQLDTGGRHVCATGRRAARRSARHRATGLPTMGWRPHQRRRKGEGGSMSPRRRNTASRQIRQGRRRSGEGEGGSGPRRPPATQNGGGEDDLGFRAEGESGGREDEG